MAREKEGYRDALERIRHEAAGEMVTVAEAAHIVYGTDPQAARKVCRNLHGWTGQGGPSARLLSASATLCRRRQCWRASYTTTAARGSAACAG